MKTLLNEVLNKNNYIKNNKRMSVSEIKEYNRENDIDAKIKMLFENRNISLHVTKHNENDKLAFIPSLNTSCNDNKNCMQYAHKDGSICQYCFSKKMQDYQSNIYIATHRNSVMLSSSVIPGDMLPYIPNTKYFRFESFGDLINENHLQNFVNIALKNPNTNFSLWTKNYKLILDFFKVNKQPKNFRIILSSLMLNTPISNKVFSENGIQTSIFTVYTADYVKNHDVEINCGGRKCIECLRCYKSLKPGKNDTINELLK